MKELRMKRVTVYLVLILGFIGCSSEKQKLIDQIKKSEAELMNDTTLMVNPEKGKVVKEMYLKFADQYADDTLSAGYLFKAADLSNGLHDPKSTIDILNRLQATYPTHPKCASALFLQAFIFDTELEMPDSAKVKYKEFIQKYPSDPLTPSAQATLDQLESGMSDEELVRKFQMMNDSLNAAK